MNRDYKPKHVRGPMRSLQTLLLALVGFTFAAYPAKAETKVVSTTGMVADIVSNIAGDCFEVEAMMGPGIDPHLYQASASDVRALQTATIIFYSGLYLEGQLGEVFDNLQNRRPVVAVTQAVPEANIIKTSDGYGVDPHVWMDASLWAMTSDLIKDELAKLEPQCQEQLAANSSSYQSQLLALHDWVKTSIASIPEEQRILVTAHDAFNYYSRAYGIDVTGIQGISTEAEAAIADIRETVDIVVERQVPAIFVESTINPRTIDAVKQAALDRGHELGIGGELYSDAMGEPGTMEGTYIGMIYANTKAITEALGGTLPPLPGELSSWAETWKVSP